MRQEPRRAYAYEMFAARPAPPAPAGLSGGEDSGTFAFGAIKGLPCFDLKGEEYAGLEEEVSRK